MLDDRSRIRALGEQAVDRIDLRGSRLGDALDDLDALRRLMNAWVRAEYREVPRSTIVLVVAAVLYFVVPTDLIPDFIVAVGFVDDVAVIGWVTRELRRELSSFRDWEQRQDAMETFIGRSPLRDD
jgi:uncharacterized membrane protein YkvA (DUF1232 family)